MAYVNVRQKSDLVNIRNTLQKRFISEKLGEQDTHQENIRLLQPLIEPLKDISQHQQQMLQVLPEATSSSTMIKDNPLLAIQGAPESPISSEYANLRLGKISDKYLKKLSVAKDYDYAYGMHPIEGSIDFKLGISKVKIDGNNIVIDKNKYIGTEGLWKLLTLKNPGDVPQSDYEKYKKIMLQTKPFLKEDGSVKANKGSKYTNYIKPIYNEYKLLQELKQATAEVRKQVSTPRRSSVGDKDKDIIRDKEKERERNISGTGFKFLSSDPNKLVNRHKILFSEMQSGNTNVNVFNELQAINDELLRLGIFDKDLIESLNNFFSIINR